MSVIVFPLLCSYCYFGDCFNLSTYKLYPSENPYTGTMKRGNFTSKVDIDTLTSEYKVIRSLTGLSKFMGMDAVSYLKMKYNIWSFAFDPHLIKIQLYPTNMDKVIRIGVRISLKARNETINEGNPTFPGWENTDNHKGTHYLKSIIYGSQVLSFIHIFPNNQSHFRQLERAIKRKIGSKGTFNEFIAEKIRKIVRKFDVGFLVDSYLHGMDYNDHGEIADLLEVKKNFAGNRSFVSNYTKLLFEFHSLSELFPTFPSVEIKRVFIVRANRLLRIFEDALVASDHLNHLEVEMIKQKYKYREYSEINETSEEYEMYKMTEEYYRRCKDLEAELNILKEKIRDLVENIDITTRGNDHQFDEVFWYYYSRGNKKYRKKVRRLIKTYFMRLKHVKNI